MLYLICFIIACVIVSFQGAATKKMEKEARLEREQEEWLREKELEEGWEEERLRQEKKEKKKREEKGKLKEKTLPINKFISESYSKARRDPDLWNEALLSYSGYKNKAKARKEYARLRLRQKGDER